MAFPSSMDLQTHVLLGFHWELELFLRPIESRAETQYQRGQKVAPLCIPRWRDVGLGWGGLGSVCYTLPCNLFTLWPLLLPPRLPTTLSSQGPNQTALKAQGPPCLG